jgi:hypothetical protein
LFGTWQPTRRRKKRGSDQPYLIDGYPRNSATNGVEFPTSKVISKQRVPMMSEATVLESRVDKLEQDNRRLKLTVGALLLALAAVPLIGAVMPEQIPELIQARQFRVIDENDTVRQSTLRAINISSHGQA